MIRNSRTSGRVSGKTLVILLVIGVLVVGAFAVWRIVLSTTDTSTGPADSDTSGTEAAPVQPPLRPGMPAYQLTEADTEALKQAGLDDPVNDLLTDLTYHPELIPREGVLGGTMRFIPSESRVISPQRVIGYYEDGHTAGRLLLEYEISAGEINWTVIQELPL